jgi:hypothetical protein
LSKITKSWQWKVYEENGILQNMGWTIVWAGIVICKTWSGLNQILEIRNQDGFSNISGLYIGSI